MACAGGIVKDGLQRIEYFDALRGIAIIMVVAIHVFGSVYTGETVSFFGVALRQIMQCAVPIFCASSAFFLGRKVLDCKEEYFSFLKKQIPRVYIPCLACALPYLVMDFSNGNFFKPVLKFFSCSYSILYFVALIIQFYILLPFIKRSKIFKNVRVAATISALWAAAYTYVLSRIMGISLPLILYAVPIFCFGVHFAVGLRYAENKPFGSSKIWIILAVIFWILSIGESYHLMNGSLSGSGLKPSAVLFSIAAVILLYSNSFRQYFNGKKWTRVFSFLGCYSFGIYLTHIFILMFFKKMNYIPFLVEKFGTDIAWGTVISALCINVIFLATAKKLMPKISRWCFGV